VLLQLRSARQLKIEYFGEGTGANARQFTTASDGLSGHAQVKVRMLAQRRWRAAWSVAPAFGVRPAHSWRFWPRL
jgi:hypothetical protein